MLALLLRDSDLVGPVHVNGTGLIPAFIAASAWAGSEYDAFRLLIPGG